MTPHDISTVLCFIGGIFIMLVLWLLGLDTKPPDSLNELADTVDDVLD